MVVVIDAIGKGRVKWQTFHTAAGSIMLGNNDIDGVPLIHDRTVINTGRPKTIVAAIHHPSVTNRDTAHITVGQRSYDYWPGDNHDRARGDHHGPPHWVNRCEGTTCHGSAIWAGDGDAPPGNCRGTVVAYHHGSARAAHGIAIVAANSVKRSPGGIGKGEDECCEGKLDRKETGS